MIKQIEQCNDYETLTMIWLSSVRATHKFLSEEDIEFYQYRIPRNYMPNVELYAVRNENEELKAFIGLNDDMIEMLFVHPDEIGKGYGSMLLKFAIEEKGARMVDVNEQNHKALLFYQKHGFSIIGRDPVDGEGKPYPILHLEL